MNKKAIFIPFLLLTIQPNRILSAADRFAEAKEAIGAASPGPSVDYGNQMLSTDNSEVQWLLSRCIKRISDRTWYSSSCLEIIKKFYPDVETKAVEYPPYRMRVVYPPPSEADRPQAPAIPDIRPLIRAEEFNRLMEEYMPKLKEYVRTWTPRSQKPVMPERLRELLAIGTQIPSGNYYSGANLARLNTEGTRKHAPLMIIIDQNNQENPDRDMTALTSTFAHMLQTAFVPTIVSHSIVHNYFVRRGRAGKEDDWATPEGNPVSFDKWHLYDVPHSQFFLFVPEHYIKYYKRDLDLNLHNLNDISAKLPTAQNYEAIIEYIKGRKKEPEFSIDNLRTILTTIKQETPYLSRREPLTKAELKAQDQLPIWDIILTGHGSVSYGGIIGDLSGQQIQELLSFFDNELPVGLFYIQSCSAGGKNLNLLEFDETINKEKVLRNLDYILIVGAISDRPTLAFPEEGRTSKLLYKLYSNAALLQGKGKGKGEPPSLDTLLNDLHDLYRTSGSPHGSTNIPQVWLPGGLGFQTYQIDEKVQILGNVKVRVHEDQQRRIVLPESSMAILVYPISIKVPISVAPHVIEGKSLDDSITFLLKHMASLWEDIPSVVELIQRLEHRLSGGGLSNDYPVLNRILPTSPSQGYLSPWKSFLRTAVESANKLLYPEFISMLRGNSKQYFKKIELRPPVGDGKELTGVMHFIRDAFFDIEYPSGMGDLVPQKEFYIEELTGNNDISVLLELGRLKNDVADPHPLEEKLKNLMIGKEILLKKVIIRSNVGETGAGTLTFILDDTAWTFRFGRHFDPAKELNKQEPAFWNFRSIHPEEVAREFDDNKPKVIERGSISGILRSDKNAAALIKARQNSQEEAQQRLEQEDKNKI